MRDGLIGSSSASITPPRRRPPTTRVAQLGDPVAVVGPIAGEVGQAGQGGGEVADHRGHLHVTRALRLGVDDVRNRGRSERPEPDPEVERRPQHDHEIGALFQQAPRAQERQLVIGGEHPAAHAVEVARHTERRRRSGQLLPGTRPVHVGTDDERRPFGGGDHPGQLGDRRRIGLDAASGRRVDLGHVARRRTEHVEREVEERRAPVWRDRRHRRVVHHPARLGGIGDRVGEFGDRLHDRNVVELLQRARTPAALWRPAPEHDDGRAVEVRRRHRRHAVGDPRARRQRREPRAPGQLGVRLGGERRRLFVAGVDDAHRLVASGVVERPDVTAVQREHHVGAESGQSGHRLLAGVSLDRCHVT
jgi:hypothetical protein